MKLTYSIPEFCEAVGISERHFFNLQKAGQGPKVTPLGVKRRGIMIDDAKSWLAEQQASFEAA